MDSLVVGAQLLLAAAFAIAGVAKLFDRAGSRRAAFDFGVPAGATSAVALLLPIAELLTAAALIPYQSARWGAASALLLLLAFVGGVANAMRKGIDVDCGCFGRVYSATAGRATLVRNSALAALAAVVLVHGPVRIGDWVAARSAAELAAICSTTAALILAAVAWTLRRRVGAFRDALIEARNAAPQPAPTPEGAPVGSPAPRFTLPDAEGGIQSLESLLARGRPLTLVFTTPTCGPCIGLFPELARWQTAFADRMTIAVVALGTPERNRAMLEEHGIADVLFDESQEIFGAFDVRGAPRAVAINRDGTIATAPLGGGNGVEMVVRTALKDAKPLPAIERPESSLRPIVHVQPRNGRPLVTSADSGTAEIAFEAFGVGIAVATNDARLLPRVRQIEPSEARPFDSNEVQHRFSINTDDGALYIVRREMIAGAIVQPSEANFYIASDVDSELALGMLRAHVHACIALNAPDHIFVQAGVVAHDGGAIVLPGPGLTGTTTLIDALVRAGATRYSDEFAAVDELGLVHPFDCQPVGRVPSSEGVPIRAVIDTAYRPGAGWRPKPLSRGAAVLELLSRTEPAQERSEESMKVITRALESDPVVLRGDRGEADATASLLLAELSRLPRPAQGSR